VVVGVTPSTDGQSLTVETADGGQGTRDHQYAGRRTRTFKLSDGPQPVLIETPGVGESWLVQWVAIGGDELLDVQAPAPWDPSLPPSVSSGAPRSIAPLLFGLAGAALLVGGLAWVSSSGVGRFPPLFALKTKFKSRARVDAYYKRLAQADDHFVDDKWVAALVECGVSRSAAEVDVKRYLRDIREAKYGYRRPLRKAEGVFDALWSGIGDESRETVTVNLKPSVSSDVDFKRRMKFIDLLGERDFEVTGEGSASTFGGKALGADVDVECEGICDRDALTDLAQRAGLTVADIQEWT
jgi:hypothetical protein